MAAPKLQSSFHPFILENILKPNFYLANLFFCNVE